MTNLPNLWPHQKKELENNQKERLMLLWSPRLGKSRAAIEFICHVMAQESSLRVLITAPLVVCPQWVDMLSKAGIRALAAYGMPTTKVAAQLKLETYRETEKRCKQCQRENYAGKQDASRNAVLDTEPEATHSEQGAKSISCNGKAKAQPILELEEIQRDTSTSAFHQTSVSQFIKSSWNISWVENSNHLNRSTISTESETITDKKILSYGSAGLDMGKELLISDADIAESHTCTRVIVMNDDKLANLQDVILKWEPDVYIGDESHRFKSPSSGRGKAMRKVAWQAKYVRLLTGTPTPNNIGNLWGQFAAIDRDMWGKSYTKFANRYLIRDSMFPSKVLGVLHAEELRNMVETCSSIVNRSEVFGPDQWQTVIRNVELPPKARKLYKDLVKEWVVENALEKKEIIDVTHTLKRMTRLQQLTSGFIVDEDNNQYHIHSAKIDMIMNDLEEIVESGEKAVVFHKFTTEGLELYERSVRQFGSSKVFKIAGDVSGRDREASINAFNSSSESSIFIVQTQAGGIGISLASALHVLFVSQGFSYDVEQQARDRVYSPGRGKCVTYYRVRQSIDGYIGSILDQKQNVQTAVTTNKIHEIAYDEVKPEGGVL